MVEEPEVPDASQAADLLQVAEGTCSRSPSRIPFPAALEWLASGDDG